MRFDAKNIKELLAKKANLIIDDSLPVEELKSLAQHANKFEKKITIIVKEKKLEDLKKITSEGNGCVIIDISGR